MKAMKKGDTVRVYPHGSPEMAAEGVIEMLTTNKLSILVLFHSRPRFSTGPIVNTDLGIPLMARRVNLNGKPWGPWVELLDGGHFEIEEIGDVSWHIVCPRCDGEMDTYIKRSWGDGKQCGRFVPLVCGFCASLMVMDLETREMGDPFEDPSIIHVMRKNETLWRSIETLQEEIRRLPNRRPVLR